MRQPFLCLVSDGFQGLFTQLCKPVCKPARNPENPENPRIPQTTIEMPRLPALRHRPVPCRCIFPRSYVQVPNSGLQIPNSGFPDKKTPPPEGGSAVSQAHAGCAPDCATPFAAGVAVLRPKSRRRLRQQFPHRLRQPGTKARQSPIPERHPSLQSPRRGNPAPAGGFQCRRASPGRPPTPPT